MTSGPITEWARSWAERSQRSEQRYLADRETVVLASHRHLAVLLPGFLLTVTVILVGAVLGAITGPDTGTDPVDTVLGLIVLAFVARFAFRLLQWWSDRIFVTDLRVFEVSGVLARRVASMPLGKVTDMTYRRSLWGRVLGFGDLLVESAGQSQALDRITYLRDPDGFYRTVTTLLARRTPWASESEARSEPVADEPPAPEDMAPPSKECAASGGAQTPMAPPSKEWPSAAGSDPVFDGGLAEPFAYDPHDLGFDEYDTGPLPRVPRR